MNLVKRLGSGFYAALEHATASDAFAEAQRLANKPESANVVFVVYRPTHIVFKNSDGHMMSLPVDEDGKLTVGDAMQAGMDFQSGVKHG